MITIKEIQDPKMWNQFVLALRPNTFLQSWEWGQVQKQSGEDVRYVGIFDGSEADLPAARLSDGQGRQVGAAMVVIVNARRGKFLLIPHGPLFSAPASREGLEPLIAYCRQLGKEVGAVALRIAPLLETTPEHTQLFADLGFKAAPLHIHAELTWVLDISVNEDEILSNMRKTTRHAIRKAEEGGVNVEIIPDVSGLDRFWPLYEATKDRHGFVPFSRDFLEAEAKAFLARNQAYFAIATHEGRDVAGALFVCADTTVFYHHGASIPTSVPAAQLLHWYSMKEAKKRGAMRYNFWGIAPDNQPDHPFAGITTFKKGFGGYAIDYLHAQDLPLSFGYWKLWLIDTYRRFRRGF